MDGALEVLQVGCDKASDLEADFVYWVPSTEAVGVEAAQRVTAKIKELGGSEKKRLQKVARAVVEKKLMPVLADIPECMKDALDGVVRSWLKKALVRGSGRRDVGRGSCFCSMQCSSRRT